MAVGICKHDGGEPAYLVFPHQAVILAAELLCDAVAFGEVCLYAYELLLPPSGECGCIQHAAFEYVAKVAPVRPGKKDEHGFALCSGLGSGGFYISAP